MIKELKNINIPNYNTFSNVNIAYLDHVEKIWNVVNKITPFEDLIIKTFDDQVLFSKAASISNESLKKDDNICFDDKTNSNAFKKLLSNLARDLIAKLPPYLKDLD